MSRKKSNAVVVSKILAMKKQFLYVLGLVALFAAASCKKSNYPGGDISPYISMYDIRNLYTGSDVTLTTDLMYGSNSITGMVVSDHSGNNLPAGLLVLQDRRRLDSLRGISVNIGADATKYVPGDSVIIKVEGAVLKRVDGILQITGVPASNVIKVSSGNAIPVNRVPINKILASPDAYESVLSVIVKGGFNPLPSPTDVFAGDKVINDGFGDLTLHTETAATFANTKLPFSANYYGIVFNKYDANKQLVPQFRMRTGTDVAILSSTIELQPIIITGYMSDVIGGDGNYEYIQLMATRDINFATTPYSVVVTNNAGASTPTGFPANGWATGGMRTYKLNLTSGTAAKGTFFYVGGTTKLINGASSTNIANANWVKAYNYTTLDGESFGTKTSGLMANSGNAWGMAVFTGTNVTAASTPVDAVFISTGGSLYIAGPPALGYRIANNDYYDIKNPITLQDQPFYRSGTNTLSYSYPPTADFGYFNQLGGEYNVTLGKWTKARSQRNVALTKTSALSEIENEFSTQLKQ